MSLPHPKKGCLGGQNYFRSQGPEKVLKIVNVEMKKEIDEIDSRV